jgi:hypothetical protein
MSPSNTQQVRGAESAEPKWDEFLACLLIAGVH